MKITSSPLSRKKAFDGLVRVLKQQICLDYKFNDNFVI